MSTVLAVALWMMIYEAVGAVWVWIDQGPGAYEDMSLGEWWWHVTTWPVSVLGELAFQIGRRL